MLKSSKFNDIKRIKQVFETVLKYEWSSFIGGSKGVISPEKLRKIIEELGGSFVKLGQFLSLRPDLIPQKYCDELSKLQDSVKPFSFVEAKKIIERSTKQKISSLFSSIDKKPIAAASIGQVYKAKMKTGEQVAVKVRRPNVDAIMKTDMDILEIISKEVKKHMKTNVFDPEEIVDELRDYTEHELDFMLEASKIRKFYTLMEGTPVKIPKPLIKRCSTELIIMEFVEGKKLQEVINSKISITEKKFIADNIVNAFFKQIFIDGFFHADPHPGNIIVLKKRKYKNKNIALLDFGITGTISVDVKESLVHFFIALMERDLHQITTAMAELHLINSESPELMNDMTDMLGPYYGTSLKQIDVPKLFIQSMKVARKNKIKVPKDYVLLGKSLITLESVCGLLDPDFDIVESSRPFIQRLMMKNYFPRQLAKRGLGKFLKIKNSLEDIPLLAKQYLQRDIEHDKMMASLSSNVSMLEKDIKNVLERFMMIGSSLVLILAAYFLMEFNQTISYSLFGIASVFLIYSFFHKKI